MRGGAFKRLKRKAPVVRDQPRPRATRVDTTYVANDRGGLSVYQQAVEYEHPTARVTKRPRQEEPPPADELIESSSNDHQWEDIPTEPPVPPTPSRKKTTQKEAAKAARVRT